MTSNGWCVPPSLPRARGTAHHVVVNGWYFYAIGFLSMGALARRLPELLWHLVRSPRRVAGLVPPTVRYSVPVFEREWREDFRPRHEAAAADADRGRRHGQNRTRLRAAPLGAAPDRQRAVGGVVLSAT